MLGEGVGRVGAGDGGGRGGPHSAVAPAPSALLRTAFLLLLLVSATWLLGLLAVNSDVLTFHYLFAVFSCLQVGGWGGTRRGRPWGGQGSPVLPPAPGETLDLPSRLRPCSPDTRDHAAAVWRCARGYGNASRSCRETRLCPQPPRPRPGTPLHGPPCLSGRRALLSWNGPHALPARCRPRCALSVLTFYSPHRGLPQTLTDDATLGAQMPRGLGPGGGGVSSRHRAAGCLP